MILSSPAKEAIKTALTIVISYAIARSIIGTITLD